MLITVTFSGSSSGILLYHMSDRICPISIPTSYADMPELGL
jgi:hypothetical protein